MTTIDWLLRLFLVVYAFFFFFLRLLLGLVAPLLYATSLQVQSGGLPPPTFAREAVQVQERRQRGGHLPKLVPIEDGDLVHEVHHFSERANWSVML